MLSKRKELIFTNTEKGNSMIGFWTRETPQKEGRYWGATLDGLLSEIHIIYREHTGQFRDAVNPEWKGYYWSEPIEKPPLPEAVGGGKVHEK